MFIHSYVSAIIDGHANSIPTLILPFKGREL